MRISDWSSDVCSSDLLAIQSGSAAFVRAARRMPELESAAWRDATAAAHADFLAYNQPTEIPGRLQLGKVVAWLNETLPPEAIMTNGAGNYATRSEEHTSELQSLMRTSYAVFCLNKKSKTNH